MGKSALDQQERRGQVEGKASLPVGEAHFGGGRLLDEACVVDEHVEPPGPLTTSAMMRSGSTGSDRSAGIVSNAAASRRWDDSRPLRWDDSRPLKANASAQA